MSKCLENIPWVIYILIFLMFLIKIKLFKSFSTWCLCQIEVYANYGGEQYLSVEFDNVKVWQYILHSL